MDDATDDSAPGFQSGASRNDQGSPTVDVVGGYPDINDSIGRVALGYAARGWAVFPCHSIVRGACTCSKGVSCGSAGKHPRTQHGYKEATTDAEQITTWWQTWRDANIGIATGAVSGLVVVDIDKKNGGFESWAEFKDANGLPDPDTLIALTGGGGRHYFFGYPEDGLAPKVWRPGIDVKSDGGHVIAAPGSHVSGSTYSWLNDQPVAVLPVVIREDVARSTGSAGSADAFDFAEAMRGLPARQRDDGLFRLACALRRKLGDNERAVTLLVLDAARQCDPPFTDEDAIAKVRQAFKQEHDDVPPGLKEWALRISVETVALAVESARLNLQTGGQVRSRPRPTYLIDEVLPVGALFQVFGATGEYKSFVLLDMLASVANGMPWMGKMVTKRGLTALILGEGGADAGTRVAAWLDLYKGTSDDLMVWSIEEGLDLQDQGCVDRMIDDLTEYRDRLGDVDAEWQVIVFDTQADHMPNGDEDKSRDFTVVKRSIQRIAQETGAAVGLVHHTGWDASRERGSSRQRQALDVVMQVRDGRIINEKQKFGPKFAPISFVTEERMDSLVVRLPSLDEQLAAGSASLEDLLADIRSLLGYLSGGGKSSQNAIQQAIGLGAESVRNAAKYARDSGWLLYEPAVKQGQKATYEVTAEGEAWLTESE